MREAGVHERDDARIHLLAELVELVAEDRGEVDAPVRDPGVGELARSSRGRPPRRPRRPRRARPRPRGRRLDLGIDRVAAEVDVEREAQALDDGSSGPERSSGGASDMMSRSSGPCATARKRRASSTVRASGPKCWIVSNWVGQEVERDAAEARLQPDDAATRRPGSGPSRPCRCPRRAARSPTRPPRPSRRTSRRACARGPTGCA